MAPKIRVRRWSAAWGLAGLLAAGCGRSGADADLKLPETTAQAAEQVEDVFANAEPAMKETATAASEAVRQGNYEKAVVALQALKNREPANMQQGLAVHGYMVTLEAQLISASESGDENAKRAYEMLRKLKRK
ncbi:MAG: hypothetical protein IT581_05830 [Verrucomicrobiales bacterium]|nr:hypothetical protein [Verrucomicrobiales bacterium]